MIYTITLNPAIDRLLYIEGSLLKKKTNRIQRVAYDIGGKGLHGSYVLTVFGLANQALGFCGTTNQAQLLELVEGKGIEHAFVPLPAQKTRESYVVIEQGVSGTTMLTEAGFSVTPAAQEELLRGLTLKVQAEDTVLIAGSLPGGYSLSYFKELLGLLKAKGCFIACDLSGKALELAVECGVNFIKPNEFELAELTQTPLGETPLTQIKKLATKIEYVVASQGAQGSICAHGSDVYRIEPPLVTEVNDTGAGDCFVGAFIGGLARGQGLEETLVFATACAASKVQHQDSSTFSYEEALALREQVRLYPMD